MEILDISIYNGRNIYSHRPVMKTIVDIGRFSDIPTKDIKGFNDRLLTCFPNLKNNTCGLGYAGGFLQRLEEGTYLAHVLEHVILDLQNTLGFDVKYGKTRFFKEPSQYFLVYEFENEICALECSKAAVFILNCFLNGEDIIIGEFLEYLNKVQIETQLGPSTAAIVNEAKKRGIPVTRIGYESLVRLGYGKYNKVIQATLTRYNLMYCHKYFFKQTAYKTYFGREQNSCPLWQGGLYRSFCGNGGKANWLSGCGKTLQ